MASDRQLHRTGQEQNMKTLLIALLLVVAQVAAASPEDDLQYVDKLLNEIQLMGLTKEQHAKLEIAREKVRHSLVAVRKLNAVPVCDVAVPGLTQQHYCVTVDNVVTSRCSMRYSKVYAEISNMVAEKRCKFSQQLDPQQRFQD